MSKSRYCPNIFLDIPRKSRKSLRVGVDGAPIVLVISRLQLWKVNATPASSVTFLSEIKQCNMYVFQKFVKIFGTRTEKVARDKKNAYA